MAGITGMGMAPLAIYLAQSGKYTLYGCDDNPNPSITPLLKKLGITLQNSIPENCDTLVHSSALGPDHPLLKEASASNIPTLRRGQFLAQIAQDKKVIAVIGSHGKTSTTALLIHALNQLNFDFSYILGAHFKNNSPLPAACNTNSPYFLLEVDESDGTINDFLPEITLAVNYDWDHASQYPSPEHLQQTLQSLFSRSNTIIYPASCDTLKNLSAQNNPIPFEPNTKSFYSYNQSAASAVINHLGLEHSGAVYENFPGVQRRQDILFASNTLNIFADYAHHPTEIAAFMDWFDQNKKGQGTTTLVYEPHRFSRTQSHLKEFAEVFTHIHCDELILLPIYAASETPIPGIDTNAIFNALSPQAQARTRVLDFDYNTLRQHLPGLDSQANVLFLGAGTIESLAKKYAKEITQSSWWQEFLQNLPNRDSSKTTEFEDLSKKTTLRVGGCARFYCEPASIEALQYCLKTSLKDDIPFYILGRGSNLIVKDTGFDGLVIRLHGDFWSQILPQENNILRVYSGVRLKELCGYACKNSLAGFEFLEGIPGSVGGSLRMNAGAMGGWIFDIIESVTCLIPETGELATFSKKDLTVGYRHCKELQSAIALYADFKPTATETPESIKNRMDSFATQRKGTQPRQPSAGCIFKKSPRRPRRPPHRPRWSQRFFHRQCPSVRRPRQLYYQQRLSLFRRRPSPSPSHPQNYLRRRKHPPRARSLAFGHHLG